MNVDIKDRKNEIEFLRMALNMCELGVSYQQADLIIKVTEELEIMKGKFSLEDGVKLLSMWKLKWQEYSENQNKEQ